MKKFMTGALLGGLGAVATWHALDKQKQQKLQKKVQTMVKDGEDYLTDYALTTLDALDGIVGDYGPAATEKLRALKQTLKDQVKLGNRQLDRETFDEQTAELREALKAAKEDGTKGGDIVIDQTSAADQPTPAPAQSAAAKDGATTAQPASDATDSATN